MPDNSLQTCKLESAILRDSRLFLDTLEAQGYEVAPPGSEVIVVDNVDTEQDGEMEDSVPEEADNGARVGDIVFDEQQGRVPARKTCKNPCANMPCNPPAECFGADAARFQDCGRCAQQDSK